MAAKALKAKETPADEVKKVTHSKNKLLTVASLMSAISASSTLVPSRLNIPELNGDVFVKRMTLGELEQYFDDMKAVTGKGNVEAFIQAIVDENNEPLFTIDDVEIVKTIPPILKDSVLAEFNVINRLIIKMPVKASNDEEPENEDLKNS